MNQPELKEKTEEQPSCPDFLLGQIQDMVRACIQCGTCSASCPNVFAMDVTPRRLWRMVLQGQTEAIFKSRTFSLCSDCYYCTLRCPRGLLLTEAMNALKQIAAREHMVDRYKQSITFYKSFLNSVRRHGRVREMEFMSLFFLSMKSPFLPLSYAPLGLRLMSKRKVGIQIPSREPNPLEAIFRKVEEMEECS